VVADGAGSAKLSGLGSKLACETSLKHISDILSVPDQPILTLLKNWNDKINDAEKQLTVLLYEILAGAALAARKVIVDEAVASGKEPRDFHTTFLLTISRKFDAGYFCASFQIGDGITGAFDGINIIPLGEPDHGQLAGQTIFLTSPNVFQSSKELAGRIRFYFTGKPPILFSMTDGVTDSYFSETHILDLGRWKQLAIDTGVATPSGGSAGHLLDWLNYYVENEHDDRTLLITIHS
jgi:hypothetical protein